MPKKPPKKPEDAQPQNDLFIKRPTEPPPEPPGNALFLIQRPELKKKGPADPEPPLH